MANGVWHPKLSNFKPINVGEIEWRCAPANFRMAQKVSEIHTSLNPIKVFVAREMIM